MKDLTTLESILYVDWETSHEAVEAFIPAWEPPPLPRDAVVGGTFNKWSFSKEKPRFLQQGDEIYSQNPEATASIWNQKANRWETLTTNQTIYKDADGDYFVDPKIWLES